MSHVRGKITSPDPFGAWIIHLIARMQKRELHKSSLKGGNIMAKYSIGDRVSWNSEAGRVSGHISKIHEKEFEFKGRTRHATKDEPQYEIESDKTDHLAAHKESALRKLKD